MAAMTCIHLPVLLTLMREFVGYGYNFFLSYQGSLNIHILEGTLFLTELCHVHPPSSDIIQRLSVLPPSLALENGSLVQHNAC